MLVCSLFFFPLPDGAGQKAGIVPEGATVEKVAGGFRFTEGPVMDRSGNILFTDIPNNRIMIFNPSDATAGVFREPSGRANGLEFDAQGRLYACEGNSTDGGRRVSRTEKDGKVITLADSYNGKRLNSPNDLSIDARGRVYFTDPRYGDRKGVEQDKESVYRIDTDGKVTRIIDDIQRPNGILITPDAKTLYVADNNNEQGGNRTLNAYEVGPAGQVSNKRVLYDFAPGRGIDGMALDTDGNIYATAGAGEKAGVYVITPQGKQLAFIKTPEDPANCTFGGADRKTLYITAGQSLYRIRLNSRGYLLYPVIREIRVKKNATNFTNRTNWSTSEE
jgi:gluconolactonase